MIELIIITAFLTSLITLIVLRPLAIKWSLIYSAENINNFTPSFALWCIAIALFDFFTVIIIRIVKKNSLMIARKDHIHHFLENLACL